MAVRCLVLRLPCHAARLALLAVVVAGRALAEDDEPLAGPRRTRAKVFAFGQAASSLEAPPAELPPWPLAPPCGSGDPARTCFAEELLPLRPAKVFDLGVVDADQDGDLDLFTTSCAHPNALLAGDGRGGFHDVLAAWGLGHSARYPGFEAPARRPPSVPPGLYVDNSPRGLVIRCRGMAAAGTIDWVGRPDVQENVGFQVSTADLGTEGGLPLHRLAFSATGDATMRLGFRYPGTPAAFRLDESVALDHVLLGPSDAHPSSRTFSLVVHDRHAMAWADHDGDGRIDVFVGKGGLGGAIGMQPGLLEDELFLATGGGFVDRGADSGLSKGTCRGREARWVDADGDGRLDLYVGCSDGRPQLHRRLLDGCFDDVAEDLGLHEDTRGRSVWLDVDGDSLPELLRSERRGLVLYRNRGGALEPSVVDPDHDAAKLAVGDVDGDLDLDVFAASPAGCRLLLGAGGGLHPVDPAILGLPGEAYTASFADVDSDGLLDLHAVPGGLYFQEPHGRFVAADPGLTTRAAGIRDARGAWADVDGNGVLDLVAATENARGQWVGTLHRGCGPAGHWLEVDLVGPPGNRQAIGATVLAMGAFDARLVAVGQGEGSHYSQGSYRVRFGLGRHDRVELLRIIWPNGERQELRDVHADGRIEVAQPCAEPARPGCDPGAPRGR